MTLTLPLAREQGRRMAEACADKAERKTQFNAEHACVFVLGLLARHGRTSGEDLVDAAAHTARADLAPHDARAWGVVFRMLARRKKIKQVGTCERRKGHGTAGGRVWEAVV